MDNVYVEVVIGRLVVNIELQLILLDARVRRCRGADDLGLHVLQPGNVLLLQVP